VFLGPVATIEELAYEYTLTENELENIIVPKIKDTVDTKWLRQMYKLSGGRSHISGQKEYVREKFEGYFEDVLKKRFEIKTPKATTLKWLAFKTKIRLIFDYCGTKFLSVFSKKRRLLLQESM
jgi:hypothetical protein